MSAPPSRRCGHARSARSMAVSAVTPGAAVARPLSAASLTRRSATPVRHPVALSRPPPAFWSTDRLPSFMASSVGMSMSLGRTSPAAILPIAGNGVDNPPFSGAEEAPRPHSTRWPWAIGRGQRCTFNVYRKRRSRSRRAAAPRWSPEAPGPPRAHACLANPVGAAARLRRWRGAPFQAGVHRPTYRTPASSARWFAHWKGWHAWVLHNPTKEHRK